MGEVPLYAAVCFASGHHKCVWRLQPSCGHKFFRGKPNPSFPRKSLSFFFVLKMQLRIFMTLFQNKSSLKISLFHNWRSSFPKWLPLNRKLGHENRDIWDSPANRNEILIPRLMLSGSLSSMNISKKIDLLRRHWKQCGRWSKPKIWDQ